MKRSVGNKALIEQLLAEIRDLKARIGDLEERNARLENELVKARKDSSTSSKPPSSDIVKPPKGSKKKGKRKKGGQPGHPKHEREPFSPEEIDNAYEYRLDGCPKCGDQLVDAEDYEDRKIQQAETEAKPPNVDEHRSVARWCKTCEEVHYAPFPPELQKGQLAGPRLTALVAFLKGVCHASFSTIRKYLRDVVGLSVSRGYLRKLVGKVSDALEATYNEVLACLPGQSVLNVDETGHKENGTKYWTWCFRADTFTLFNISQSRGSDVLLDILGEDFEGVIGCDYFSAYRKYMKDCHVLVQFCFAHLIRDVKFLTKLRSRKAVAYGERLLNAIRELFSLIHSRQALPASSFKRLLEKKRDEIIEIAISEVPENRESQNLANRFRKHGKAYFEFITTPGIEPTNNLAEQAIRFVVLDRVVTQGTRSAKGREWCERIWTVIATCAAQGRSVFKFLVSATEAHFRGEPAPSLLHAPP